MLRVCVSSPKIYSLLNGFFEIQAYGLFFVIGLFCFLFFFCRAAVKKLSLSHERLLDIVVVSAISGFIGARLLYVLEYPELLSAGLWTVVNPRPGGLSVLGGLAAAPLGGAIACWAFGVRVMGFLDLAALYAPIIDVFGRLGCFFGGCCYGVAADSFVSVVYLDPVVAAPVGVPLFPVQIIASLAFLGLFAVLVTLTSFMSRQHSGASGALMCSYFAGAGLIRFCIDFLRGDRSAAVMEMTVSGLAVSVTWYQSISLLLSCIALLSAGVILYRARPSFVESE